MTKQYMKNWQPPKWTKPQTIYWYVDDNNPEHTWGFDTYEAALQYALIFDGHVEITRPDNQLDLFN